MFANGDRPDELFSTDTSAADTMFPTTVGCKIRLVALGILQ